MTKFQFAADAKFKWFIQLIFNEYLSIMNTICTVLFLLKAAQWCSGEQRWVTAKRLWVWTAGNFVYFCIFSSSLHGFHPIIQRHVSGSLTIIHFKSKKWPTCVNASINGAGWTLWQAQNIKEEQKVLLQREYQMLNDIFYCLGYLLT